MVETSTRVSGMLADIRHVGRDATRGGVTRFAYSPPELELREWFVAEAERRSLDVETDRNGLLWAWRAGPMGQLDNAVVTGSHLDSVPGGGEFDGPLGIVSAFAALDVLDARGTSFARPLAVVAFPEEEGGRFGRACLGSQVMTGDLHPDQVLGLRDVDGVTLAEAVSGVGLDPAHLGRDDEAVRRMGAFVELHVEQGRGLVDLDRPVAVASSILGHGRWRLAITGEGNHAGATLMTDRRDPMVAAARIVVAARDLAKNLVGARATVGRLQAVPGGTNVIASRVHLWLDVRHPEDALTRVLVAAIAESAARLAALEGCECVLLEESYSGEVTFDARLRDRLLTVLPEAPVLATGAGHDAGVLAAKVPTAMLFTRNPTGVSHSPAEHVEDLDAEAGAEALADVLADLLADA